MTKEDLAKLREGYDEEVKNKEMNFPFEEESKEEKEEKTIVSNEEGWVNIHRDFTPELVKWWQEYGFSYEEARDWINIGMGITDVEFCACWGMWRK